MYRACHIAIMMANRTKLKLKIGVLCAAAGVIGLIAVGLWFFDPPNHGLNGMKKLVRKRFPHVRQLTTDALADWLDRTNARPPILLDVRTRPEFGVSHLPGARRVDPDSTAEELLPQLETNRPIVLYCSVGYRSSQLADRLQKAGLTNVYNLEGSIFAWANEERSLVRDDRPTERVHPYNDTFGKMLKKSHRADISRLE
jgi:rhodanese-related sulfurtransferase